MSNEYYTSNYHFLQTYGIGPLKKYIYDNINTYVQNIYLRLENNTEETECSLIELLNNQNLKLELKKQIIIKENTVINDISEIKDLNVQNVLLQNKKVFVSWENIYHNYIFNGKFFSDIMIEYLSASDIAEELSKVGPGLHALPRSKLFRFRFSGTPHRCRLSWA